MGLKKCIEMNISTDVNLCMSDARSMGYREAKLSAAKIADEYFKRFSRHGSLAEKKGKRVSAKIRDRILSLKEPNKHAKSQTVNLGNEGEPLMICDRCHYAYSPRYAIMTGGHVCGTFTQSK